MPRRALSVLLLVLALAAASCSGGGDAVDVEGGDDLDQSAPEAGGDAEDPAAEDTADEGADDGDDGEQAEGDTLIAAMSGEPDQLDPHRTTSYPSFQVLENVYDTLVQPNADLEFEPALATEWETSEDQLTWTFTTREDVAWHDGEPFSAEDVAYSLNRIIDEELANAFRFGNVESITAPDETTVVIELAQPTPNLLANVGAFKGMAIVREDVVTQDGADPVGTGPFRFVEYSPGSNLVLETNEDYWGDVPAIAGVEFRFIPEGATRLTALETGEVDWIDSVPPQNLEAITTDEDLVSQTTPSTDYYYYALNHALEPFDDPLVREALAYGFDRQAVAEAAEFGAATVNQTAIPEDSFYYHDYAPYSHDPDLAMELLAEAGAEDLSIDLLINNAFEETIAAAQVLEAQWGEIGVEVQIRTEENATWLDEQGEGNFDAFLLSWIGNLDPDEFYYAQHVTDGVFNFHGYSNPDLDELLEAGRTETDEDARAEIYDQVAEIIVDANSYTYLYNPDNVQAWQPALEGYEVRPDGAVRFKSATLTRSNLDR